MALILKKMFQGYFWLFDDLSDRRSDGYLFMTSPFQPLAIGLIYLYLIFNLLPKFMKNREPYKLNTVMVIFNAVQVIINAYMVYHAFFEILTISWTCSPVDYSETPHNNFVLKLCYTYFALKVTDLLDTVFFVLRKKDNQVSFLHVYHHFGMIGLSWVGVRFFAGGHSVFIGFFNCFVHTIMYFYYFLTIWKPEYKKSIWWKKYITQMQLTQFVIFLFLFGQILLRSDCAYPKFPAFFIVPQSIFMIFLFSDFYWKAYIKPKRK